MLNIFWTRPLTFCRELVENKWPAPLLSGADRVSWPQSFCLKRFKWLTKADQMSVRVVCDNLSWKSWYTLFQIQNPFDVTCHPNKNILLLFHSETKLKVRGKLLIKLNQAKQCNHNPNQKKVSYFYICLIIIFNLKWDYQRQNTFFFLNANH